MTIEDVFKDLEAVKYRTERFSNESGKEFLPDIGLKPEHYRSEYVSIEANCRSRPDMVYVTELQLARLAINKHYVAVTGLDHCRYNRKRGELIIKARGWVPKR